MIELNEFRENTMTAQITAKSTKATATPTSHLPAPTPLRDRQCSALALQETPLLTHAEEALLGTRIASDLGRLARLVRLHPRGYELILERVGLAARRKIRVVQWFELSEHCESDFEAGTRHLEEARTLANRHPARAAQAMGNGARHLKKYELDPENLIELARQISLEHSEGALFETMGGMRLQRAMQRLVQRLRDTRDQFILANQRLVAKEISRFDPAGMERADLYQEGILGVGKAAYRFDATRGLRFSTYAVFWIRQSISKALIDHSRMIRVPQTVQSRMRKSHEDCGLAEDELRRVQRVMKGTISESTLASDDETSQEGFARFSHHERSATLHLHEIPEVVRSSLTSLDERERFIVQSRFGVGRSGKLTLEQIGKLFNLSRERIRQIEQDALRRLRKLARLEDLHERLAEIGSPQIAVTS